ncbi:YqgE/AlgH family protein [Volucribacter amazonae]|uniref:UPF0301 protein A6A20_05010 n=1 Tax=Volucribacter amazonae TaxID=256731 RepID=A0A9X4PGY6_9PAST|nr:YqgE/AlgH family protein [Volucribacter amazonae]MDG6895000.1 hypothetical protein [Volucribacter amazonae]
MKLDDHFLIAMPQLNDEYFYRAVIYMCEHNKQGSMGLVLTQPTDLSIAELVAKMNFMMANDRQFSQDMVLAGGPVNIEHGFILHTKTEQAFQHSYKITDRLQLTTSGDIIDTFGTARQPEKYLVALGCASWSPNQLENEIADDAWLVVPANEHILFDVPYDRRWLAAMQILGIQQESLSYQAGHA